ncbi:MAG: hypothetical protein ACYTF1_12990 [Planctomycetota bacterium]|jgi:hypothetical protein
MNKAQKRTWFNFAISLATLLIGTAIVVFVRIYQIDIYNFESHKLRFILLGYLSTIPLIMIVIISIRFRTKDYDERDKLIDRQAVNFGMFGAFIFLAAAACLLNVITRVGSIKVLLIFHLVYFAYFVYALVSSVAALILYRRGG